MTAIADRPAINTTQMGLADAKQITEDIRGNFDSLGSMLMQARDRKAYKTLGYRSFDTYCKTEFGKSISHAYQLIEDVKVVAELEAEISKQYDEPISLNFPSSHLRPLKELPGIEDKLKAIEYAQKLATAEGKKPTKNHLEIAVFEISGRKPKDFKSAIESLGFKKGAQVEVTKSLNQDRGFITRVDKRGKIHVELYYSGVVSTSYDAGDLRILKDTEKPAIPANDNTANKGDKVKIFARGLEGKTGEIYTWKMGKHAMVTVDSKSAPVTIAYAQLEVIKQEVIEVTVKKWHNSQWEVNNNNYYYFENENKIVSSLWPIGLSLEPYSQELESPAKFMEHWEERFAGQLLEGLVARENIKTLVLAQAIEFPENECKEFVADLITSLSQLYPQASKPRKAMGISFSRTINELTSGKKTQTRRAWQDDYAKNFIRYFDENIVIPALDKGRHRGGHELGFIKLTQRPYQQYLSEMSLSDLQEEGGMVETAQEFIDTFFEGQDKLAWVLNFEFLSTPNPNNIGNLITENQQLREQLAEAEAVIQQIVDAASSPSPLDTAAYTEFLVVDADSSSPLDTAAHTEFLVEDAASTGSPLGSSEIINSDTDFPQALLIAISDKEEKIYTIIDKKEYQCQSAKLSKREVAAISTNNLKRLRDSLQELRDFRELRIGQLVTKRFHPEINGRITGLELSSGGMPHVLVKWNNEETQEESGDHISIETFSAILTSQPDL